MIESTTRMAQSESRQDLTWVWVWISALLSVVGLAFMAAFAAGWRPGALFTAAFYGASLFFRGLSWRSRRQFRLAATGNRSDGAA